MSGYRSPWAVLEIEQTNDDRAIRKAYSAKLKQIDVEADPAAFIALREAMEQARRWAAYAREDDADEDGFDEDAGGTRHDPQLSGQQYDASPHPSASLDQPPRDQIEGIEVHLSPLGPVPLVAIDCVRGEAGAAPVAAKPIPPVADIPHFAGGDLVPPVQRRKVDIAAERTLALPDVVSAATFPSETPLLAEMLQRRSVPHHQAMPDAPVPGEDIALVEAAQAPLYPEQAEPDFDRWAGFEGGVSFRRDDWGNADRERLADLLSGTSFGPAEAAEVDRLADILLASDHLDALDYRDFMENWLASIIAGNMPRSDGVLVKASAKFLWGTDTGQLHHSPALDACFARNRDLEAERKLNDSSHKFHKIYKHLQLPSPEKLAMFSGPAPEDVQAFLDRMRVERPTLEWSLDRNHVALWDAKINDKLNRESSGEGGGFKWYHLLFIIFIGLQVLTRLPGVDTLTPPPVIERPDLTDYQALASGNEAEISARNLLAGPFNASNKIFGDPKMDLSRYLTRDDLYAYVTNACNLQCYKRVGDMRLALLLRSMPKPSAQTPSAAGVDGAPTPPSSVPKTWSTMSQADRVKLEEAVAHARKMEELRGSTLPLAPAFDRRTGPSPIAPAAMPNPAPVPAKAVAPKMTPYKIKWTYNPDDPNIAPTVELTQEMKAIGFTKKGTAKLSQYLTRKSAGKDGYTWECGPLCVKYADYVESREERLRFVKARTNAD